MRRGCGGALAGQERGLEGEMIHARSWTSGRKQAAVQPSGALRPADRRKIQDREAESRSLSPCPSYGRRGWQASA